MLTALVGGPTAGKVNEKALREEHPVTISLLHATYRAGHSALGVRGAWLSEAAVKSRVEHIFALDANDAASMAATQGFRRVVGAPRPGRVTAVRNWNAAASVASGDLLFVIADDLLPPTGWDVQLSRLMCCLDPRRNAFAVKVFDGGPPEKAPLLRHPVVSRAFYSRFGLFDPRYDGVYCDNDLSKRAFWRAVIIDGREMRLQHCHPDAGAERSESHQRMNDPAEYVLGLRTFGAVWGHRLPWPEYLLRPTERRTEAGVRTWATVLRARSAAVGVGGAVVRHVGRPRAGSIRGVPSE